MAKKKTSKTAKNAGKKTKKTLKSRQIVVKTGTVKAELTQRIGVVQSAIKQLRAVGRRTNDWKVANELVKASALLKNLQMARYYASESCAFQNQNAGLVVVFDDK